MCIIVRDFRIGTVLTGQDSIDFINYMCNPTYTDEAYELMIAAIREEDIL